MPQPFPAFTACSRRCWFPVSPPHPLSASGGGGASGFENRHATSDPAPAAPRDPATPQRRREDSEGPQRTPFPH
ncbi:hypothetical protein NDU88_001518 [Pleurodeles waltl]|uniref:Uncharacterized protein n=1 Tax=Pleurodeles waltl TaxID=8319 RepID=A0AAV7WIK1_PLEWA|nr:hypothetical protein NDU88_001518 [Pleurodeles waltl]